MAIMQSIFIQNQKVIIGIAPDCVGFVVIGFFPSVGNLISHIFRSDVAGVFTRLQNVASDCACQMGFSSTSTTHHNQIASDAFQKVFSEFHTLSFGMFLAVVSGDVFLKTTVCMTTW